MSVRYVNGTREGGGGGNYIPSGRQLPRTPPLTNVKRHLDFNSAEPNESGENSEEAARGLDRTFDAPETKTGEHTMLKGMKGYQLTQSDLDFIKKMEEERLLKKLQRELDEVRRLLRKEMMAAEMACAAWERAHAKLKKLPTPEELTEWATAVLKTTQPSAPLTDVDTRSLLAMLTKEGVRRVLKKKMAELVQMAQMVENKKKEAEEREQLEKHIASEQLKVQGLMSELSDLKSELAQEEEAFKALEMQTNNQNAPEIKAEKEGLQEAKSKVKHRGKERKKVAKSDTTTETKSRADDKGDRANKDTSEPSTKPKSKSAKAARGQQKKVEENQSNPQDSKRAVRGQRKAAARAASQPRSQSEAKTREVSLRGRQKVADAGEEAPNAGPRRSKRIASRK